MAKPAIDDGKTPEGCPICNSKMRKRGSGFRAFWGCKRWPDCDGVVRIKFPKRKEVARPTLWQKSQWVPTPEQAEIFSQAPELLVSGNFVSIQARAGASKTSSVYEVFRLIAEEYPRKTLAILAFNVSIAEELAGKFPVNVYVANWHKYGLRQILRWNNNYRIDKNKMSRMAYEVIRPQLATEKPLSREDRANNSRLYAWREALCKLISHMKNAGFSVAEINAKSIDERLTEIIARHKLRVDSEMIYQAKKLYLESLQHESLIDLDDQLLWPAVHPAIVGMLERFDIVAGDEVQDYNGVQHKLILAMTRGHAVFPGLVAPRVCGGIFVGDPFQAIYGFRGALHDSIDALEQTLVDYGEVYGFTLSVSQRISTAPLEFVQALVPDIYASPRALAGSIDAVEDLLEETYEAGESMVIGRTNAVLVKTAYRMMRQALPIRMLNPEFGEILIDFIKGFSAEQADELADEIRAWFDRESQSTRDRGKYLEDLKDRCDALIELCAVSRTKGDVAHYIERMFDQGRPMDEAILITTAHKCKGLERPHIVIVGPELFPHYNATDEWELAQERNLLYVAMTRTQDRLVFVGGFPRMILEGGINNGH